MIAARVSSEQTKLPDLQWIENDKKLLELHDTFEPESSENNFNKLVDSANSIEFFGNTILEDLEKNLKLVPQDRLWSVIHTNQTSIDKLKEKMRKNNEDQHIVNTCTSEIKCLNAFQLALQLTVPDSALFMFGKVDQVTKGKLASQIEAFTKETPKNLEITKDTCAFLAARILRSNNNLYSVLLTSTHAKRQTIMAFFDRFGLPASHLEPFYSTLSKLFEEGKGISELRDGKVHVIKKDTFPDYNYPCLIERTRKDHPNFDVTKLLPEDFFDRYDYLKSKEL